MENKPCIFPFKYKGKFYASCTKADTTNGKAWCATEVDDSGTVIDQKWGDCNDDCFTSKFYITTVLHTSHNTVGLGVFLIPR